MVRSSRSRKLGQMEPATRLIQMIPAFSRSVSRETIRDRVSRETLCSTEPLTLLYFRALPELSPQLPSSG